MIREISKPTRWVQINNALLTAILCLSAYLLASPYVPFLTNHIRRAQDSTQGYHYVSHLASGGGLTPASQAKLAPTPKDNRLVIPQIGVDGAILEGATDATLDKGIWHRPDTGTPGKPGNVVLVAHRFYELNGPNTFYSLNELSVGNRFAIFWQGTEYDYIVTNTQVVAPTDLSIESPTTDQTVTLYTCTPLWTSASRLVVTAKPISINET